MKAKLEGIKQILYVLFPLFVFVIIYDVSAALLTYILEWVSSDFSMNTNTWYVQNQGTLHAICITGALFLTYLSLRKLAITDGFLKVKKEVWKIPVLQYVLLVLGTVVISYGMNYLFTVTGLTAQSETYQNVAQKQYEVILGIGLILYGVISPFVEEVIFRGFLYGRMRVYMKKTGAILLSALLFGVYHGNLVQGIYGFIMGIIFTLVYEKYKNFYLAVVMHSITNLVGYFIRLNGFL